MNKSTNIKWIFPKPLQIIWIFIFGISLLIFNLVYVEHISTSEKTIEFTINKPYLIAVSELAKKESLEETIQESGSELVSKEWKNFEIIAPNHKIRLREYELFGDLDFTISKKDNNLGNLILSFNQKIKLNKEEFIIETKLDKGDNKILKYEKFITISPDSDRLLNKAKIKIKSLIQVKNKIPFFANKIMDQKVNESNIIDLDKTKKIFIKKINNE